MTYSRIVKSNKRDRATSLMYGLSFVCEIETESKQKRMKPKNTSFDPSQMFQMKKPILKSH
jgi:hypothetical protein